MQNGTDAKQFDSAMQYSHVGEVSADFNNNTISFPVEIMTTLGVTQNTYDWAKVGGAVFAGLGTLLGAGFVLRPFSKNAKIESPEEAETEEKSETPEKGKNKKEAGEPEPPDQPDEPEDGNDANEN